MTIDRQTLDHLAATAKERHEAYAKQWLAVPEFVAALHRYDHEFDELPSPPMRTPEADR